MFDVILRPYRSMSSYIIFHRYEPTTPPRGAKFVTHAAENFEHLAPSSADSELSTQSRGFTICTCRVPIFWWGVGALFSFSPVHDSS